MMIAEEKVKTAHFNQPFSPFQHKNITYYVVTFLGQLTDHQAQCKLLKFINKIAMSPDNVL